MIIGNRQATSSLDWGRLVPPSGNPMFDILTFTVSMSQFRHVADIIHLSGVVPCVKNEGSGICVSVVSP
jgi:hypothetical protein